LTPSQIVALVKATPQLKIDRSVPPSPAFDPYLRPRFDDETIRAFGEPPLRT
jgi:hypothetical protein